MRRLTELLCLGLAIVFGLPGAILMALGYCVLMIASGLLTASNWARGGNR